jgi:hypothetical protein
MHLLLFRILFSGQIALVAACHDGDCTISVSSVTVIFSRKRDAVWRSLTTAKCYKLARSEPRPDDSML